MEIIIAAAIITRADGALLLVRKHGTTAFMQPGGKIDVGESPRAALCRELSEELGIDIAPDAPQYIGQFSAPAANEAGHTVTAALFRVTAPPTITVQAEIAEAIWLHPDQPALPDLAPLTRDHVLPLVRA
ncbi:MutT family NTP pyrophosphatase [Ketogulonicigenium robustum]|uniref:MutT family NTP pyrophosphatase n=1 Tax=Ketogulonicigenium robustum TaxID=92947 RepID=A0A1W6P161_9RHOB|nr:NUDIX domain-containing protein [Ketogulonicigenium robustum]ARO15242.1 MutT family NTP pyrophosphatase [Ketogulonicigenium robustum]